MGAGDADKDGATRKQYQAQQQAKQQSQRQSRQQRQAQGAAHNRFAGNFSIKPCFLNTATR